MKLSKRVDSLLGSMSIDEKVGQVFVLTLVSLQQAENDLRLHPGGYIRIYSDALTVARQNRHLRKRSALPLLLAADFERGIGSTVAGAIDMAGNMCLGAADDDELAYQSGRAIAEEAAALGINTNYVPVMDVNIDESNPIINIRAFGAHPEMVARLGCAFIRGTQDGGLLACCKHFPGHGDTHTDSHTSMGVVDAPRHRLEAVELLPFRRAVAAGVDMVMSAHLRVPALEPEHVPATMSRRIMHQLLREELGFEGVALSDAMDMGGIVRHFSTKDAVERAFNAGCDQLIMPRDNAAAVGILAAAVRDKRVSEHRLDEAVARILTMKERRGLFEAPDIDVTGLGARLNTPEHYELARQAALSGITLLADKSGMLPLAGNSRVAVISLSNSGDGRTHYTDPRVLGPHCVPFLREVRDVNCGQLLDEELIESALAAAREADAVVLAAYVKVVINAGTVNLDRRFVDFVQKLVSLGKPVALVSFGSPYVVKQFPEIGTCVCAYGASEATQEATALLVCGKAPFRGKLPVPITLPA